MCFVFNSKGEQFMRFKKLMLVLILLMLSCGCTENTNSLNVATREVPDTIRIGIYEPITGIDSGAGKVELLGIQYAHSKSPAIQIDNKECLIELVEVDSTSSTDFYSVTAEELVSQNVTAVIGGKYSGSLRSALPIFENAKIPIISPSVDIPGIANSYNYGITLNFDYNLQGNLMATYANNIGISSAAIVYVNTDAYSNGMAINFENTLRHINPSIDIYKINVGREQTEFNSEITQLSNRSVDIIYAPLQCFAQASSYYKSIAANFVKQARSAEINCPILGADIWQYDAFNSFPELIGLNAGNVLTPVEFNPNSSLTDTTDIFVNEYMNYAVANGHTDIAIEDAARGYDSYMLLIDAIKRSKTIDSEGILEALLDTKGFEGATGLISINPDGSVSREQYTINKYVNGKWVFDSNISITDE